MSHPDEIDQKEYKRLKTRLTKAINKKESNPEALLKEATDALNYFSRAGYPDSWSRWERAKEDAEGIIRRRDAGKQRGLYHPL